MANYYVCCIIKFYGHPYINHAELKEQYFKNVSTEVFKILDCIVVAMAGEKDIVVEYYTFLCACAIKLKTYNINVRG